MSTNTHKFLLLQGLDDWPGYTSFGEKEKNNIYKCCRFRYWDRICTRPLFSQSSAMRQSVLLSSCRVIFYEVSRLLQCDTLNVTHLKISHHAMSSESLETVTSKERLAETMQLKGWSRNCIPFPRLFPQISKLKPQLPKCCLHLSFLCLSRELLDIRQDSLQQFVHSDCNISSPYSWT